ncbi:thioesterase II family protein [Streptomyces sp. NPDC007901]|uniref:thioesterase II family protein n=1 Tax=Streptomyces sp. NPDC007901 TaxID=3364785 RepID=UPI0036E55DB0
METAEAKRWLRRYHSADAAACRLLVLPHAGGSASFYHPLSARLASSLDVLVVQYPGRHERRREAAVTDLLAMADHVVQALLAQPTSLSTAVFGHSMGATLGFEVVRRLETFGVRVPVLFASARRAPSRGRARWTPQGFSDERLLHEMAVLGGAQARVLEDRDVREMVMPAVRSDYQAVESYRFQPRPSPRVQGAVMALTGESDPTTGPDDVTAWAEHTSGGFSQRTFHGGHFYLAEQWTDVAETIGERIEADV